MKAKQLVAGSSLLDCTTDENGGSREPILACFSNVLLDRVKPIKLVETLL